MEELLARAHVLLEALPYVRRFHGRTVVIKCGGAALREGREGFAQDVALLSQVGVKPVVVHGGGPQIDRMLRRLGMEVRFREGLRVTDEATLEVVEMVLRGSLNPEMVRAICRCGAPAVGISGVDGRTLEVRPLEGMGRVGRVERVNPELIRCLQRDGFVPVVAPLGVDPEGRVHNVNADLVAGQLAAALGAVKLVILTDVPGVLDEGGRLIPTLTVQEARRILQRGASGGMIPKLRCCLEAMERGVDKAHIIDGRREHALLLELLTEEGIGTQIVP